MAAEPEPQLHLEIAHVLYIDVVGYSKLLINDQSEVLAQLNQVVRETPHFREGEAAGKLIRLPTGDGMALVFLNNAEAPVECALEIGRALQSYPHIQLRMGVHSGPINPVSDVNDRANVAGAGINMAQRVMDCGDAGHILVSRRVAEDLEQYRQWRPYLRNLGECEAKHGMRVHIFNLCTNELGNPNVPAKLKRVTPSARATVRSKRGLFVSASLALITLFLALGFWGIAHRPRGKSTSSPGGVTPGAISTIPEKTIAVLPFENLSAEKDDAFFADGIQDDVLTTLGKIKDLTVIARSSVMVYRGAAVGGKLREIGKTLGVSHVLEGSVRRSANRVVVNVKLIDTRDDHQVWSERYDRTLTDSIGLQGELATEIAHALRANLDPQEQARLVTRPTNNPEAYVLYLRARETEKERTVASMEDNVAVDRIYDQAIALDPKFAVAMARQSIWNSGMYFQWRSQEPKNKAHALALAALRIAPDLPEAHLALGEWFRMTERNYDAALKELLIAAQTMPNDPEVLRAMGSLYRRQGRWREALASFRRAQELNPGVPDDNEAQMAVALRDWKTARVLYRHYLEMAQDDVDAKMNFANALMIGEGDFAAAKALLDTIPYPRRDGSGNPVLDDMILHWELSMLERDFAAAEKVLVDFPLEEFPPPFTDLKGFLFACTAWARGDQDMARERFEKRRRNLESLIREHPDDPMFVYRLGMINAYLGRKEEAVRESRRAIDLVPANDAIERPRYLANLALVYALTGETEEAVTLLEQLLTTPMPAGSAIEAITLTELRSWKWDSLRTNPRFQKILAGPEPKTVY
jgi:TolB-like protein/Flp pilus assembly protein TadD/class 3 adenylate cyclase